jgi:hypothetical protein
MYGKQPKHRKSHPYIQPTAKAVKGKARVKGKKG